MTVRVTLILCSRWCSGLVFRSSGCWWHCSLSSCTSATGVVSARWKSQHLASNGPLEFSLFSPGKYQNNPVLFRDKRCLRHIKFFFLSHCVQVQGVARIYIFRKTSIVPRTRTLRLCGIGMQCHHPQPIGESGQHRDPRAKTVFVDPSFWNRFIFAQNWTTFFCLINDKDFGLVFDGCYFLTEQTR